MSRSNQCGFSLVEMVATIVILGIALVTITTMMVNSLSTNANTYEETRMTALARAYLDEIMSRRYDENSSPSGTPACDGLVGGSACSDPPDAADCSAATLMTGAFGGGVDSGESTRDKYDDVDDYHCLDEGEGGVLADLHDAENNVRSGYEGYRVTVTVAYAGDQPPISKEATDAKLITVTVYSPLNSAGTEFQVYKANF